MGDMLAFADNPFFVVGGIIAVSVTVILCVRAWRQRNTDVGGL